MPRPIGPLTPPALLLDLLVLLFGAGNAYSHGLDAQAFLLKDHKIQVESWFSGGEPARAARVQVFHASGQLLTEGRMNDQGIFVFSYENAGPLRIVVSAGGGHRKEISVSAESLQAASAKGGNVATATSSEGEVAAVPLADRGSAVPVKDVLVGVGFLLALAAFVLSLRNARYLRQLKGTSAAAGQQRDQGKG